MIRVRIRVKVRADGRHTSFIVPTHRMISRCPRQSAAMVTYLCPEPQLSERPRAEVTTITTTTKKKRIVGLFPDLQENGEMTQSVSKTAVAAIGLDMHTKSVVMAIHELVNQENVPKLTTQVDRMLRLEKSLERFYELYLGAKRSFLKILSFSDAL